MLKKLVQVCLLFSLVFLLACRSESEVTLTLLAGQDTLSQNSSWEDAGVLVEGDNINKVIYTNDTVDTSVIGLVRVTYAYQHKRDTITIERYIMVTDASQLSIELVPGVDTVMLGETWEDAGVHVAPGIEVSVRGTVNTHLVGTYEIVYTITNSAGQSFSVKRIVTVID